MDMFTGFPDRLKMKTYDEEGNIIDEWDEDKGWFEDGVEQNEYGEWLMNRIYHPYTDTQIASIQLERKKAALMESRRQLTPDEVTAFFVKSLVNTVDIPDQTSLRMLAFHPSFADIVGQTVKKGFKFTYNDCLYRTNQPDMTIQSHYPPGEGNESLYTRIDLEHTGAIYDPIPYAGNMELFENKYYIQNNDVYFCNRSSATAMYHSLSELVGLYVTKV